MPDQPITQAVDTNIDVWAYGSVRGVYKDGNILYVVGEFTEIGLTGQAKVSRDSIAAIDLTPGSEHITDWNPTVYHNSGTAAVNSVVVYGNTIYVGGYFNEINGQYHNGIAAFNKNTGDLLSWDPDISSSYNPVHIYTLDIDGSTLYVGGYFTHVGQSSRYMAASFSLPSNTLTSWKPLLSKSVFTFAFDSSTVYVGGLFNYVGSRTRRRLASFDKSTGSLTSWNPDVENSGATTVEDIVVDDDRIYVGGKFEQVSGQTRKGMAIFDKSSGTLDPWAPSFDMTFTPMYATVHEILIDDGTMFVGGYFEDVDGEQRIHLASFNMATETLTSWNPSLDGAVEEFYGDADRLYTVGWFTRRGGYDCTGSCYTPIYGYAGPGIAFFYDSAYVTPTVTPTITPTPTQGPTPTITPTPTVTPTPVPASDFQVRSMRIADEDNPGEGICGDMTGVCTLEAAIQEANALAGEQTVDVPAGVYVLSTNITDDLVLVGNGETPAETRISLNTTISGGVSVEFENLTVEESSLTVGGSSDNLTLTNVHVVQSDSLVNNGTLTVTNSLFETNTGTTGGAINSTGTAVISNSRLRNNYASISGGAIYNAGNLTLTNTTVEVNSTDGEGGGIRTIDSSISINQNSIIRSNTNGANGGGGLSAEDSTVSVEQTTIKDNQGEGTTSHGGGISISGGSLTVTDSLIESNSSGSGAGIYIDETTNEVTVSYTNIRQNDAFNSHGGGLYINPWYTSPNGITFLLENSTVKGNRAEQNGGGIYVAATVSDGSSGNITVGVVNSTIGENSALAGGGVYNDVGTGVTGVIDLYSNTISNNKDGNIYNTGQLRLKNSLLDNPYTGDNCTGSLSSSGYNISSDGTCSGSLTNTGDQNSTDPTLNPIAFNGGSTQTYALQTGSPAIDAADPGGCTNPNDASALTTDQRGTGFDRVINGRCDVGAYEYDSSSPPEAADSPPANTYVVDSTDDSVDANPGDGTCADAQGNCTLRAAVMELNASANGYDIKLPAGIFTLTLAGMNEDLAATGDIDILSNTTIYGESSSETIIDARGIDRALEIGGATDVAIQNVTVRNGDVCTGGTATNDAGAIRAGSTGTHLDLTFVKILRNTGQVGGVSKVGNNSGSLSVASSLIESNDACTTVTPSYGGIYSDSDTTIDTTIIRNNKGDWGGGASFGDGLNYDLGAYGPVRNMDISVTNSTVELNDALDGGGGGIHAFGANVGMQNTSIRHNRASCPYSRDHCHAFSTESVPWADGPGLGVTPADTYSNGVPWGGGGILAIQSYVNLSEDTRIDQNATGTGDISNYQNILAGGGGMGFWGGTAIITDTSFIGNKSYFSAGALLQGGFLTSAVSSELSVSGVKMHANSSEKPGGALYSTGIYGRFVRETSSWGSIESDFDTQVDIQYTTIESNKSGNNPVYNNYSTGGGGIYFDVIIDDLMILDSTVAHNHTTGNGGGGMYVITYQTGTMNMKRINIYDNWVDTTHFIEGGDGGGLFVDSYALDQAYQDINLRIENTTVSDNKGYYDSGRYSGQGGGMHIFKGMCTASLTRSTWPFARGDSDQGVVAGLATSKSEDVLGESTIIPSSLTVYPDQCAGLVELYNVTIARNEVDNIHNNGVVNIKDSIIAESGGGTDCTGGEQIASRGYNTISDGSCDLVYASGSAVMSTDLVNEDPGLEPLRDNGGNSFTHSLMGTSSALDAGDPSGCSVTGTPEGVTDQRGSGYSRYHNSADPSATDGRCDRGAYEFAAEPSPIPTITPIPPAAATATPTPTVTPTPTDGPSPTPTPYPTQGPTSTFFQPTPTSPPTNTPAPVQQDDSSSPPVEPQQVEELPSAGIPVIISLVGGVYFILSVFAIRFLFREQEEDNSAY